MLEMLCGRLQSGSALTWPALAGLSPPTAPPIELPPTWERAIGRCVAASAERFQDVRQLREALLPVSEAVDAGMTAQPGAAVALELSCRFLGPLLEVARAEIPLEAIARFLATWNVQPDYVTNQTNWVSLRFVEAFADWIAEHCGADRLTQQIFRSVAEPRDWGFVYALFRAAGSPRTLYQTLPRVAPMLNKVSTIEVRSSGPGSAVLAYGARFPDRRERSPSSAGGGKRSCPPCLGCGACPRPS